MNIGRIINEYRISHDLTMQELADRSGLSKGYISMLEKGVHPQNGKEIVPSIETVQKLAKAMGMTVDVLLEAVDGDQLVDISHSESEYDPIEGARYDLLLDLFKSLDEADQTMLIKQAQFLLSQKEK